MLVKIILAMTAFAANSLLCRLALKVLHMDAVTFGSLRLLSGGVALFLLLQLPGIRKKPEYNLLNAALLALYVFAFSLAYMSLTTAAGALLLFGTVQVVMTFWGLLRGERLTRLKSIGMLAALGGLLLMGEAIDGRMLLAIVITLSGIGLVIVADKRWASSLSTHQ